MLSWKEGLVPVLLFETLHVKTSLLEDFNSGILPPPPCWFSLNNSETVKAVTLAFCNIQ